MARNDAVWGIDIGNTSLKAIRCRASSEPGKIEITGFDFIEHSKIMSQPGADPAEILNETIKEFLARNKLGRDKIAISVSGQNTISRFLKLPPVDAKKVPDIIKYEAKQWLPFDLQDVVWDYQPLGKGLATSGIVLDSEVGMFAMKRDIAMKNLAPYIAAGIDVDYIQSTPLAVYNYIVFDYLNKDELDPENPPDQIVVLSVGTDATDVIITNGISIWTRSIPIGGNLFTKALTKGMKLTFTKAEYLKRNAASAEDPKAVFQAMRPVFNDMLSEVNRSLEYYSSLNRNVKFSRVIALGNALKMNGLRLFLEQNLGQEVVRPTVFNNMVGPEILNAPVFKENLSSFGVAYGLAAQALKEASLSTNLMPRDVVVERVIREKKPWALAGAAAVLLGLTVSFAGAAKSLDGIKRGEYDTAETKAKSVETKSSGLKSKATASVSQFTTIDTVGKNLTGTVEGRIIWMEFLKAINEALVFPPTRPLAEGEADPTENIMDIEDPKERSMAISMQDRIYITAIDTAELTDGNTWWTKIKDNLWYQLDEGEIEEKTEGADSGSAAASSTPAASSSAASSTAGTSVERTRLDLLPNPPADKKVRLVQLSGYHYHNNDKDDIGMKYFGPQYLRLTFCKKLKEGSVQLPVSMDRQLKSGSQTVEMEEVTFKELGFMYPVVFDPRKPTNVIVMDPKAVMEQDRKFRLQMLRQNSGGIGGMSGGMGGPGMSGSSPMGSGMGDLGGTTGFGNFGGGLSGSYGDNYSGIQPGGMGGIGGGGGGGGLSLGTIAGSLSDEQKLELSVYNFVIQFLWYETPPSERDRLKEEEAKAEASATDGTATPATDEPAITEPTTIDPALAEATTTVVESVASEPTATEPEPTATADETNP